MRADHAAERAMHAEEVEIGWWTAEHTPQPQQWALVAFGVEHHENALVHGRLPDPSGGGGGCALSHCRACLLQHDALLL